MYDNTFPKNLKNGTPNGPPKFSEFDQINFGANAS